MSNNKSCPQCLLTELRGPLSRRSLSPDDGRDIYGAAQHHNQWDILSISIMAHTLLPNYNTTNVHVRCHISCSLKETQQVLTTALKASS